MKSRSFINDLIANNINTEYVSLLMRTCCICERPNLSERDENEYVLLESSPDVLKRYLFQQGYDYRSHYVLCHRCMTSTPARLKLMLKERQGLIKRDAHVFNWGEVTTKSYWFTLEINVHGYTCVYDKKTRMLVNEKMLNNKILIDRVYKKYLFSVLEDILEDA